MPGIIVVGSSCAGKTMLARRLSRELGIRHIQLDALFWLPDWVGGMMRRSSLGDQSFLQPAQALPGAHRKGEVPASEVDRIAPAGGNGPSHAAAS